MYENTRTLPLSKTTTLKVGAFALGSAFLIAACGDANTTVSCTTTTTITTGGAMTASETCTENATDDVSGAQAGCMVTSDGGTGADSGTSVSTTDMFAQTPCSHVGAVGGCQLGDGTAMWFYAGWTAQTVQQQCAMNGGTFLMP